MNHYKPIPMKYLLLGALILFSNLLKPQNSDILKFDLVHKTLDTLHIANGDTTITSESTPFYTGNYDRLFCNLDMEIPDDPVYPESHFITRQKVSDFYNVNEFPIRTSIKLFRVENDSLKQKCSGSLISRYHVLTACHCVAKFNIDSLLYDAFWVYPAYDKGKQSPDFGKSQVNKIYFFQHWNINHTDFAILELDQPLGDEAGWIGMGFEIDDSHLSDGMFYKFSYPGRTELNIDSTEYNGDTLYFGHGTTDWLTPEFINFRNTNAIPGESGSSIIKIRNGEMYTSYGVLSWSGNMSHSRFEREEYFALKSIISNDMYPLDNPLDETKMCRVYPNPVASLVNVTMEDKVSQFNVQLYDVTGRILLYSQNNRHNIDMDLSILPNGIYFLQITSNNKQQIEKIVKN